ncbi:MAG: acetolactate synthase large subunit [Betaproteobacteria bacterium]|nr:acetolactate synthase large subunit [Betaproteobacteria bacterium]
MKVYKRLAEAFKAEGTSAVFGIMGDANMYWYSELDKLGVQLIEVRHEGAGLGMADGWARSTHTPGVASSTCGPGTSQLATGLLVAARAESPLVAFCGAHPTNDDGYNQRLDQGRFAAACETAFVPLNSAESADDVVRKAFYLARLESRPVMFNAPMDIQQKEFEDDEPYQPSSTILPRNAASPAPDAVQRALDIISKAKRPVIVAGRGARWSGAGDAILKLAERTGALIATSLMAKTWLSKDPFHIGVSGLYATKTAIQLLQEADVVIGVGASLNRYTTEHGYLYPNAKFVHLDTKPHVLMGNARSSDVYMQTDAKAGVEALEAALAKQSFKQTGYRTPEVKKRLVGHFQDRAEFPIADDKVDPREVVTTLDDVVPTTISLLTGSGATGGFSNILFTKERPLVMASHFFGCIGQMMPAAMGAVVASGYKPHVLVDGDASVMMHLAEFETMVRYKMPLLIVVLNNEALGSEYYKLDAHKMDKELSVISTPDLGGVAKAFGGKGKLARTVEEVRSAAAEWVANPGPMIIDARIERSVVTLPYRRIHYGRDE